MLILQLSALHNVQKRLLLLHYQHTVLFLEVSCVPFQVVWVLAGLLLSYGVQLNAVDVAHLVVETLEVLQLRLLVVSEGDVLAVFLPILLEVWSRHVFAILV